MFLTSCPCFFAYSGYFHCPNPALPVRPPLLGPVGTLIIAFRYRQASFAIMAIFQVSSDEVILDVWQKPLNNRASRGTDSWPDLARLLLRVETCAVPHKYNESNAISLRLCSAWFLRPSCCLRT